LILADHVWSDDSNDGVPEPVGGGGETDTTGSDWEWEDLTNENPRTRSPGGGEEEDEDGDECNLSVDGRDVDGTSLTGGILECLVESNGDTNDGNQELTDQHTTSTNDQKRTTTKLLYSVEREWSRSDVDSSEDHGNDEWVGNGTGGLEERSRVVEDKVDTSPLLHHLKRSTENGAAKVRVGSTETTAEASSPGADETSSWDDTALVLIVGDDLSKLGLNVFRLGWLSTKSGEGSRCLFELTALDVVTWGIWESQETTSKDKGPCELDGNWDAVLSRVTDVLCDVNDDGGEEDTNGDTELVTCNQSTTNSLWSLRGVVSIYSVE